MWIFTPICMDYPYINAASEMLYTCYSYDNDDIDHCKYALTDLSGDGIPELIVAVLDSHDRYLTCGIYTISNGNVISLIENPHVRNRFYIAENSELRNERASGAANCGVTYYSLKPSAAKLTKEYEYVVRENGYYYVSGNHEKSISSDEYQSIAENHAVKELDWNSIHNPTIIYDYFEKNHDVHLLNNITGSIDDDGLVQMQNCISLLHSAVPAYGDQAFCDIPKLDEYDLLDLMNTISYYMTDFIGPPAYLGELNIDGGTEGLKFIKMRDMYAAAYKYFGIDIDGVMETFDKNSGSRKEYREYVDKIEKEVGERCITTGIQNSVWHYIKPRIETIYSLGNGVSYVIYEYRTEIGSSVSPDTEPRRSIDREHKNGDNPLSDENRIRWGYAIIKNRVENGKNHYYIQQCGCSKYSFLSQTDLNRYITQTREPSNIKIDYSKVKGFEKPQEYIDYLLQMTDNVVPNDSAVTEIVEYIEYAIGHCTSKTVKVSGKKIKVDKETIADVINQANDVKTEFDKAFNDKGITLNSVIKNVIQLDAKGASLKKGVTVVYDESVLELVDKLGAVRIVLDGDRQSVYAASSQMKNLITGKTNSVSVKQKGNQYTIDFKDAAGQKVEKGADVLTFIFQTSGNFDSVFYHRSADDKINWGGQLNGYDKTIEFLTSASGEYSVERNAPTISDIGDFDEETAEAIKFMVSRGFFKLDGDEFKPFMSLSRYDFTKAIVSIFYDTDFDAESTFADVSRDNEYYTYVASAEQKNTVYGYEDNTFRGDNHATREEIISIAARTLADKKGYYYPENTDDYVCFADNAEIQGWENQYGELALSVREGLIDKGGFLAPKNNITRVDAAVILYRLFHLLYNITPTQTQASGGTNIPIVAVSACGGTAVPGAAAYILIRKRMLFKGGTK